MPKETAWVVPYMPVQKPKFNAYAAARHQNNYYAKKETMPVAKYKTPSRTYVRMKPNPKMPFRPRMPKFKRRPKRAALTSKIKQAEGTTKSYYTHGTKRMSRVIYDLFKNNQRYEVSSIDSLRVDNNNYGSQGTHVMNTHPNINSLFALTLERIMGRTPTTNEKFTSRITYGKETIVTTYSNQEITPCYLDIYELEPRFHISNQSITPLFTWIEGLKYETDTVVDISSLVYQSPFRSSYFANYYKVLKIIRVELPPGGIHKHISTYYHHKGLHGIVTANHPIMSKFSHFRMNVVSGTPINDKLSVSNVSTSTVALDIVQTSVYDFTYSPVLRDKFINTNNLPVIVNVPDVISMFAKTGETEA